jgi:hypothetical protein
MIQAMDAHKWSLGYDNIISVRWAFSNYNNIRGQFCLYEEELILAHLLIDLDKPLTFIPLLENL